MTLSGFLTDRLDFGAAESRRVRRWRWVLAFAAWTVIGLFFSLRVALVYARVRARLLPVAPEPRWWLVANSLVPWYLWGLLALPILRLARWAALSTSSFRSRLALFAALGVACVGLHAVLSACFAHFFAPGPRGSFPATLQTNLVVSAPYDAATYAILLLFAHSIELARRARAREVQSSRLQARLAEAELQLLRAQLDPHFLFNTLHAISVLLRDDPAAAERTLQDLSELLRQSLENTGRQEIPLRSELEFLRRYLEILRVRFGSRLTVRFDVQPGLSDVLVPNLILQPLVENAIRHGVAPHARPGRVEIVARRRDDRLELSVRDNGAGLPPPPLREGIGLSNTRVRLAQLYGPRQRLTLKSVAGEGVTVEVSLPLRRLSEPLPAQEAVGA